jgi:hypothetical protein
MIQAEFDGITRDGRDIVIRVAIGEPHDIPTASGDTDAGFYVDVEPLMERRTQVGTDSFMAMCFAIELVRKALKIFVAHGGSVYFRRTRSPIDLKSYCFEVVGGLLRPEFLEAGQTPPSDAGTSSN